MLMSNFIMRRFHACPVYGSFAAATVWRSTDRKSHMPVSGARLGRLGEEVQTAPRNKARIALLAK